MGFETKKEHYAKPHPTTGVRKRIMVAATIAKGGAADYRIGNINAGEVFGVDSDTEANYLITKGYAFNFDPEKDTPAPKTKGHVAPPPSQPTGMQHLGMESTPTAPSKSK